MSAFISLFFLTLILYYAVFNDGAVEPFPLFLSLAATGALSVTHWLLAPARDRLAPPRLMGALMAAALLLAAFQLLPLPVSLAGALSPARVELQRAMEPLLGAAQRIPLSAVPDVTAVKFFLLLACLMVLLIVRDLHGRLRERPWTIVFPLLLLGSLEGLLGIVQHYSGGGSTVATGTYVNRNHFAGLLEMCLPFAVLYAVAVLRRGRDKDRHNTPAAPAVVACLALGAATLMLLGVLMSMSRMGFIASLTGLLVSGVLAAGSGSARRWRRWVPALVLVAAALGFVFLPHDSLIERFASISSTEEISGDTRTQIWRETLGMIRDYPLFGCGLGSYESCFVRYKTVGAMHTVDFAHNDYLQAAAEFGLIGFGVVVALAAVVIGSLARRLNRERSEARYVALAAAGSLAAMLLHAFVDFNLYIPANALALCWVAGIAVEPPGGISPPATVRRDRSTPSP